MRAERRPATIECAGNGRGRFELPATSGVQWGLGAVSTATWTGVPLAALLERAGAQPSALHFWMEAADRSPLPAAPKFLRSIPREAALADALVAYEMNGQPVPFLHGGPLRLVMPRWFGMASTKWLTHVHARPTESDNHFMVRGYRYADGSAVDLMRVKSLITAPRDGEKVPARTARVSGVAWTGSGTIAKVEISSDDGRTWQEARCTSEPRPGAWRLWEADVTFPSAGEQRVRARATDTAGETQPDRATPNPAGYGNNSIRRCVSLPPDAPLRTEVRVSTLCATSRRAIVAAFLATVLAVGCRSAGVDRKAVSDPRLSAVTGPAEAAETAGLPDGPGKTLVSERCLLCHGAGLIVQQRKDAAAWGRTEPRCGHGARRSRTKTRRRSSSISHSTTALAAPGADCLRSLDQASAGRAPHACERQMTTIRIALANLPFPPTPAQSVTSAEHAIAEASAAGADVICFPECFVPGYRAAGKLMPPPDSAFLDRAWSAIGAAAREAALTVVLGTERVVDGAVLPSAVVIDRDGTVVGFQDKVQIDLSEETTYTSGSGRRVFEAGALTFGIVICHEGWRYRNWTLGRTARSAGRLPPAVPRSGARQLSAFDVRRSGELIP